MKEESTRKILNDFATSIHVILDNYYNNNGTRGEFVESRSRFIERALIKIQKKILSAQKQQPLIMSITFKELDKDWPQRDNEPYLCVFQDGEMDYCVWSNDFYAFYYEDGSIVSLNNPVVLWSEKPDGKKILEELK